MSKWGRANYWPGPKEIIQFDVLHPLLKILRQWPNELVLYIIKSHAGYYHNELADEQAAAVVTLDGPTYFVGPQKYGTSQLRIRLLYEVSYP